MVKNNKRPKKKNKSDLRKQLAFDLAGILESFEESFVIKLKNFYRRLTFKILNKADNLKIFNESIKKIGETEIKELSKLLNTYYKQIGKISIRELNKEIKVITGITTKIKVGALNEGLRYRAEQLAKAQATAFKKQLRQRVNNTEDIKRADKAELKRVIRKASKVFINRHIVITSRMESVKAVNLQRIEATKGSKILKGWQFLAVLDDNTTDICRARANKVIKAGESLLGYTPPLHFGCRSLLSPVTIYEKNIKYTDNAELEKIAKKYPSFF